MHPSVMLGLGTKAIRGTVVRRAITVLELALDVDLLAAGVLRLVLAVDPAERLVGVARVVGAADVPAVEGPGTGVLNGLLGVVDVAEDTQGSGLFVESNVLGGRVAGHEEGDGDVGGGFNAEGHGGGDGALVTKGEVEDQLARRCVALGLGSVTLGGVKPEVTALAVVETERLDGGAGVAGSQALAVERLVIGAEFEAERLGLNVVLSRGEASNGCEEDD
jgi:hypothetical protein